jgi:hypothetical protein
MRLHRAHSERGHPFEFLGVLAVKVEGRSRVRAHRNLDPVPQGVLKAHLMALRHGLGFVQGAFWNTASEPAGGRCGQCGEKWSGSFRSRPNFRFRQGLTASTHGVEGGAVTVFPWRFPKHLYSTAPAPRGSITGGPTSGGPRLLWLKNFSVGR